MYPPDYIRFELPRLRKNPGPKGFCKFESSQQIREGFNSGALTNNFSGIDIDLPELISRFESKYREFITAVIETPRGGRHYYGANLVHNEQNDGWDIRGWHGYLVCAGSRTRDGVYRCLTEIPPVAELKSFPEELFKTKTRGVATVGRWHETDPLCRIASARRWLAKADPAVQGKRGSDKMFFACCRMFQVFNLTMDQAIGPILEYNARCMPPFSEKEIRHKLEDAQKAAMQ